MPPSQRVRSVAFICRQTEDTRTRTELFKFLSKGKINAGVHCDQSTKILQMGSRIYLPNAEKYYGVHKSTSLHDCNEHRTQLYNIETIRVWRSKICQYRRKNIGNEAECYITLEAGPAINGFDSAKKLNRS